MDDRISLDMLSKVNQKQVMVISSDSTSTWRGEEGNVHINFNNDFSWRSSRDYRTRWPNMGRNDHFCRSPAHISYWRNAFAPSHLGSPNKMESEKLRTQWTIKVVLAKDYPISHNPDRPCKCKASKASRHDTLGRNLRIQPQVKKSRNTIWTNQWHSSKAGGLVP